MKHKIDVPEGCRVVSVETTDEMVVVKFEKEDPEFKENDIVTIDNFLVAIDGRNESFQEGSRLTISRAGYTIKVVKRYNHPFFDTLRSKLMWGADVR